MAIPCPGSATFSKIYGVGRNGPDPITAFIRALIVLVLELARDNALRRFLSQDCKAGCDKIITGPDLSRFTGRLRQMADGRWVCVLGFQLDARIDCVRVVEASLKPALDELLAYFEETPLKKRK